MHIELQRPTLDQETTSFVSQGRATHQGRAQMALTRGSLHFAALFLAFSTLATRLRLLHPSTHIELWSPALDQPSQPFRLHGCVVGQVDAETRLMSDSTARACISVRLNAKIHNSRTSQHPISLFHAPPIDHETPSNTSWGRHMP